MAYKISYRMSVSDGFTKNLNQFQKIAGKIPPKMAKVAASVSKSFGKMGSKLKAMRDKTAIASVAMVAGFTSVLGSIVDFEREMNNIEANSFASAGEMKKLRAAAREMGATTAFSAGQAAQALAVLAQAGFKADKSIRTLPSVLSLAAAGSLSMGEAAKIMTVAMAGMDLGADQAGRIGDVFAQAAASAKTSVSAIGASLVKGGKAAKGSNISLEQAVAASAILQDSGTEASTVGRVFSRVFRILSSEVPTLAVKKIKAARKEMIRLFPEINKAMKKGDLVGSLKLLKEIGLETNDYAELFGANFYLDAEKLALNSHLVGKMNDELVAAHGVSKKMAAIKMQGIVGEIEKLKSAFGELVLILGDAGITNFFIGVFTLIRGFIGYFSKANPLLLQLMLIVAGIVAIAAPLLAILGLVASGIAAIAASPFAAMVIGIVAAVTAALLLLTWAFYEMSQIDLFSFIWATAKKFANWLTKMFFHPLAAMVDFKNAAIKIAKETWEYWEKIFNGGKTKQTKFRKPGIEGYESSRFGMSVAKNPGWLAQQDTHMKEMRKYNALWSGSLNGLTDPENSKLMNFNYPDIFGNIMDYKDSHVADFKYDPRIITAQDLTKPQDLARPESAAAGQQGTTEFKGTLFVETEKGVTASADRFDFGFGNPGSNIAGAE